VTDFEHDIQQIGSLKFLPRSRPPRRLYHYTSEEGLLGILVSNRVWASDVRYANDTSELVYADQVVKDELERLLRQRSISPAVQRFLSDYSSRGNIFSPRLRVFAFCVCEAFDRLSQWREYAVKGAGYAIGFASAEIAQVRLVDDPPQGAAGYRTFQKVIYEPGQQHDLVRRILVGCATVAERHPPQSGRVWLRLNMLLSHFRLFIKDFGFHEENEWRAVAAIYEDNTGAIKRRTNSNGEAIPYVEAVFPGSSVDDRLPIAEIMRGPNARLGQEELDQLVRESGFPGVEITRSYIPRLRS
jgi:hypothetical protein